MYGEENMNNIKVKEGWYKNTNENKDKHQNGNIMMIKIEIKWDGNINKIMIK